MKPFEASLVLDLDGNPQEVVKREDKSEMAVTIGADGFSYTRAGDESGSYRGEASKGFKLGSQV